jgi:hypothetical protein
MNEKNVELALATADLLLREAAKNPTLAVPYAAAAVVAGASVLAAGEVLDWLQED